MPNGDDTPKWFYKWLLWGAGIIIGAVLVWLFMRIDSVDDKITNPNTGLASQLRKELKEEVGKVNEKITNSETGLRKEDETKIENLKTKFEDKINDVSKNINSVQSEFKKLEGRFDMLVKWFETEQERATFFKNMYRNAKTNEERKRILEGKPLYDIDPLLFLKEYGDVPTIKNNRTVIERTILQWQSVPPK